jgi:hypothetical protein
MNLELSIDLIKLIGEITGKIDTFVGLLMLKVFGNLYFNVLFTFDDIFPVLLCSVNPVIELGILSDNVISIEAVTKLLSLYK